MWKIEVSQPYGPPRSVTGTALPFLILFCWPWICFPSSSNSVKQKACVISPSQWPRCVRHEMSPPARTLGSWVWISLKARMYLCVYSVFVLGSGLATGWSPVQEVLPTEVKQSVSRMPYAPSGSNRNRKGRVWDVFMGCWFFGTFVPTW
jgi:hypothetical protein